MKKFCPLLIGLLLLGSLNSCDWIRSRLGMPTSDELKLRQSLMLRDSLDKVARAREDSILEQTRLDSLERIVDQNKTKRYHVVMGSFIMDNNAQRMMKTLTTYGFTPLKIEFANGYAVISAFQTDDLSQACKRMNELFDLDITPHDIWIYDINQNLHK